MAKRKTNWKKKATDLWSSVIREVGYCEICSRKGIRGQKQGWKNLDAHHLISKIHSEYRTDLSNGICLCIPCHQWDSELSPHQNRAGFEEWLKDNRSGQWIWYNEHYPLEGEKEINGNVIKCRIVKKTLCFRVNWRQEYERLLEIMKR